MHQDNASFNSFFGDFFFFFRKPWIGGSGKLAGTGRIGAGFSVELLGLLRDLV